MWSCFIWISLHLSEYHVVLWFTIYNVGTIISILKQQMVHASWIISHSKCQDTCVHRSKRLPKMSNIKQHCIGVYLIYSFHMYWQFIALFVIMCKKYCMNTLNAFSCSVWESHIFYFWFKYDLDRSTMHPSSARPGFALLIMTVHFMSLRCLS